MPEGTFETPQTAEPMVESKPTNWPKIILAAVLGFALLFAAAYTGYWYGTQEISNLRAELAGEAGQLKTQNQVTPTPAPVPSPAQTPSPAEDETANWKTYTNTKYGYTLKYPQTLPLVKGPVPDNLLDQLDRASFGGMEKSGDANSGIVISIGTNITDASGDIIQCSTGDQCVGKRLTILGKDRADVAMESKRILGKDVSGFSYETITPLYTQKHYYFIFTSGSKVWEITLTANNYTGTDLDNVLEIFDQIFSTFKFLN